MFRPAIRLSRKTNLQALDRQPSCRSATSPADPAAPTTLIGPFGSRASVAEGGLSGAGIFSGILDDHAGRRGRSCRRICSAADRGRRLPDDRGGGRRRRGSPTGRRDLAVGTGGRTAVGVDRGRAEIGVAVAGRLAVPLDDRRSGRPPVARIRSAHVVPAVDRLAGEGDDPVARLQARGRGRRRPGPRRARRGRAALPDGH